ncbi:MAG: nucleotidyl transferase AbiEii/AbiGii toxin family protein [Bacteroidales bacterium]|nr:nucleotidyl transferase AbiEii/AbiGii toxin family protein [Bacteroidales bacterium]
MDFKTDRLFFETVSPQLVEILLLLMKEPLFSPFVLVGGTNLSLRLGHRKSVDIDLFTDCEYGSLDFTVFEDYLKGKFPYYDCPDEATIVGFGRSFYIGESEENSIKLDLMYADAPFFEEYDVIEGIRIASLKQIAAMKMEAINHGGRKKDWWDIHELLNTFTLEQLLSLHQEWEPWTHNKEELLKSLVSFDRADQQPDPICLRNKNWDEIKLDIIDEVEKIQNQG